MNAPPLGADGATPHDVRISPLLIDLDRIGSVALRRLVEEVRNTPAPGRPTGMYDRIHNRHNR